MDIKTHFEEQVEPITESGCWIWTGSLNKEGGYGTMRFKGERYLAHREAYKFFKGPIPKNMNVCHTCDIPSCVNPDHLFIGTQKDNVRDCISKGRHMTQNAAHRKTHCKRGHEFTPENTNLRRGFRECITCVSATNRKAKKKYRLKIKNQSAI